MLYSFALIILLGLVFGFIAEKLGLPKLIGMLISGILIGPFAFNLLDESVINMSSDLRRFALIVILTRAGLNLNFEDLKKVGRPAFLLSFLPATFEILGTLIIAPMFFKISYIDALVIGSVLSAVSPAVIVPRMLNLIDKGYGKKKNIPLMIMASSSLDDIYVILLFTVFTGLSASNSFSLISLLDIPISVILGALSGFIVGVILNIYFRKFHIRDSIKVLILLSISFLLSATEDSLKDIIAYSSMLAVITISATLLLKNQDLAKRLSVKYTKIWIFAELLLFTLVGASVDISLLVNNAFIGLLLIILVLGFRMIGVLASVMKTKLNNKEKLFLSISFMPKATVQAAIGGIPLALGLSSGELTLTLAVLSILFTAPLGAFLIDKTYDKLLEK